MLCGSEDIIQTFTDILILHCDLDLDHSNLIFPQNTPAYGAILSNQVWLQRDQRFRRYSTNSHILIIEALKHTNLKRTLSEWTKRAIVPELYALIVTLALETLNHFLLHDSLAHDNA